MIPLLLSMCPLSDYLYGNKGLDGNGKDNTNGNDLWSPSDGKGTGPVVTDGNTNGKVTVTIVGAGRVYSSPTKNIDCPSVCTAALSDEFPFLNAQPADGWMFSEWQGDDIGCFAQSCPLTPKDMQQDLHITAVFEQVDYG